MRQMGMARPRPFGPGTVRPTRHYGDPPVVEGTSTYSWDALAGAELAARQADRPVILADHALREAFSTQRFPVARWTSDGTTTGPDVTHEDYPTYRAFDGHNHRVTKPRGAAITTYFVVDFGEGNEQSFDAAYLRFANLSAWVSGGASIEVADDGNFSSNLRQVVSWELGGAYSRGNGGMEGPGLAHAVLGHTGSTPLRFTGVRFLRVIFRDEDGPVTGREPELGELWLGRSYQLPRHLDTPQSDRREESQVSGDDSRCGITARRVRHTGAAVRPGTLTLGGDEDADALAYWWRNSREGAWPVVLITDPYTGAQGRLMRTPGSPVFDPHAGGPKVRRLGVELAEAAPFAGEFA